MIRYWAWCMRQLAIELWNPIVDWIANLLTVNQSPVIFPRPLNGNFYSWSSIKLLHQRMREPNG